MLKYIFGFIAWVLLCGLVMGVYLWLELIKWGV